MQAVQHQSQWQLQFEPRTTIGDHCIGLKVRRGNQEYDHANLGKIRLLQREEGLERFVIHGWCTLLLLLEDVRPDDIIESCYTIETRPRLLPGNCALLLTLPQGIPVGKFHFSLRFNESRPMKWKSASADLKTSREPRKTAMRVGLDGENYGKNPGRSQILRLGTYPVPGFRYQIAQIGETVAVAIAQAWKEESDETVLAEIAKEIADQEPDALLRVRKGDSTGFRTNTVI